MEAKLRIEQAKERLKKAEQAKTVAETQKATAEKQRDEVVASMTAAGVTPETIQGEIDNLATQIDTDLTKIEGMIPTV